jgi:predicted nucleotidyltransferase
MASIYKILAHKNQRAEKYFRNPLYYARKIKRLLQDTLPDVEVIIFGSAISGKRKPDSDIDILVISEKVPHDLFERTKIRVKMERKFPDAPFEIHLATPKQFLNWYKNFIKSNYIRVK